MPAPHKPTTKRAPVTKPCVCCRERDHDAIPDRDLDGYVCTPCVPLLRSAKIALAAAGITDCVQHPRES